VLLIALALGSLDCAIPGRPYRVAPAISGSVRAAHTSSVGTRLELRIVHRDSALLSATEAIPLPSSGSFGFDAVELVVAGHEYSKLYQAFLVLQHAEKERVLWRAEFSRRALAGPIRLDCWLERPASQGQPCQVRDPLEQPWLLAEGRRTFRQFCAECHGADGSGGKRSVDETGVVPPDLRAIAQREGGRFDRAAIAEWVEGRTLPAAHGPRSMPVWGERLSAEYEHFPTPDARVGAKLDPVVVYLESLQEMD